MDNRRPLQLCVVSAEMTPDDGTRATLAAAIAEILRNEDESICEGRENRALGRFSEIALRNSTAELAERVGVFETIYENANECGRLQRNARGVSNLASSSSAGVRVRLRLFAEFASAMSLEMTLDVERLEVDSTGARVLRRA